MNKISMVSAIKKIVAFCVIVALAVGIYWGVKFLPMTGDEQVGNCDNNLVIQSSVELDTTNVNSLAAGKVAEVLVKEGDVVVAGQCIAVLESDTFLAKKQQAEAAIQAAQGQIKSAEANYQKAKNGATAEQLAQAKAGFELAEATYNRMQVMWETEAISQSELDQVATQYEVAKQQYIAAQKGAEPEDLAAAAGAVEAFHGQLAAAQGTLAEVESYLDNTVITSPVSGIITTLNASDGELVSTGLPIAVVTTANKPWITCKVMEDQLNKVTLQQEVTVRFPAYPDRVFTGIVTQINKNADFAVKRATNDNGSFDVVAFSVKVNLEPEDADLYAGMTAFVDFGINMATESEGVEARWGEEEAL